MPMLSYRFWVRGDGFAIAATVFAGAIATAQGRPPQGTPPAPAKTGPQPHAAPLGAPAPPVGLPSAAPATAPLVPGSDTVHFTSRIGSFKVLGNDTTPVQGTLDLNFDGTVLVSGLTKGTVEAKGGVRLEKETADHVKKVYFGKGELVIHDGKMRSFQLFGKDITGTFKGYGIFRLYGEFDKKLETGFIWYDGDEKRPWGTGGNQVVVPNPQAVAPKAKVRIHPAG